ncbi:hypothetical protein AX14_006374 [Amanita brunnescens Koide BX004]|nr:hypothetical protein AX14_006374 [Amanita brunnescens Koide BX004]
MVAATVSALPNIPMQTAISTAIETVRAAGPAILSQPTPKSEMNTKTGSTPKRPPSPASSTPTSGSAPAPRGRSQAPSPSPAKQAQPTNPAKPASMTFAQIAASVLDPPTGAAPIHAAKARPTWRAVETNKSLVLRSGTKGTRVSELHIRVPKVAATTHLFSLSGTKLIFFFF